MRRYINIQWDIKDVQERRPDLDDLEALEVLDKALDKHDANVGITWEVLENIADDIKGQK